MKIMILADGAAPENLAGPEDESGPVSPVQNEIERANVEGQLDSLLDSLIREGEQLVAGASQVWY